MPTHLRRILASSICLRRPERLAAACGLAVLLASAGCTALYNNPVPENVISARQISLRGIDAMDRGRFEEAEALFASAIETCPSDERAHRRYAELLWRRGAQDDAVSHMEESVRLSGGDPQLLVQLGEMYLERGQAGWAWEQAQRAIQSQRNLASAWALCGDILHRQQRLDDALAMYHRALSHQPEYERVQIAAAEVYRKQGRPRRALATLEVLAGQYPPDEVPQNVLLLEGLALKALGRNEDAVDVLAVAVRRGEPSAELLYHLSEAQLDAGDTGNARLAARAALVRSPTDPAIRDLNVRIDRRQQQLTAAIERL